MLLTASSFLVVGLTAGPSSLDEKAPSAPPAERAVERGSPALFSWGDADGDARLDLAAVSEGGEFANAGEGHFENVTERVGLAGVADAALARR
jgi:hypothetical protein